jgi:hypothetical protein
MDDARRLDEQLQRLQLHYIRSHYQEQASKAAEQQHPHIRSIIFWPSPLVHPSTLGFFAFDVFASACAS